MRRRCIVGCVVMSGLAAVLSAPSARAQEAVTFAGAELVGRPTATSATLNVITDEPIEAYVEYGMVSGAPDEATAPMTYPTGAVEILIDGLSPDTEYSYRLVHRRIGEPGEWTVGAEGAFHTQRPPGSAFTFAVQSDSHQGFGAFYDDGLYAVTLGNILDEGPDFLVDLGDTFSLDGDETEATVRDKYLEQRSFFDLVGHSVPLYLVLGNHENEEGWNLDDEGANVAASLPVLGANARKRYFLNPVPDGFYTGNLDTSIAEIDGDHLKGDYYAFQWGDALFVMIDPFWYTQRKPYTGTLGGEDDDEVVGDRWDWTLGEEQYDWFRTTLEGSDAPFKFVFTHHLVGGLSDYGRGGARGAPYCEWGGKNTDGSPGFVEHRPGWYAPIHQLLVENGVTIVFHGHDHVFARDELDGITYQLLPFAASPAYDGGFASNLTDYAGADMVNNSGHLRVAVDAATVTVDYVRSFTGSRAAENGDVAFSYTLDPVPPDTAPVAVLDAVLVDEDQSIALDVLANDTDAEGDALELVAVTPPTLGSAIIEDDQVVYVPEPDSCTGGAPDVFSYTVSDGRLSREGTVEVTVVCVADPPAAEDQSYSVVVGNTLTLDLLTSYSDPEGDLDPASLAIVQAPTGGTLTPNGDGTFEYQPDAGFAGEDTLVHTACDLTGHCATATVSIDVRDLSPAIIEVLTLEASPTPTTAQLSGFFVDPVVVCTPQYANNTTPIVVRVGQVGSSSFDVRLQSPQGSAIADETVSCVVVETGVHLIDGVPIEAQKYSSDVTDNASNWNGQPQTYGQTYTNPVVLGQVMSENDPRWSVFWARGVAAGDPPSASTLYTGKHVGEDPDRPREDETIGFVVFESGHGTLAGVEYEALVGANAIQGVDNGPPFSYAFASPFGAPPQVGIATLAGMNGINGGFAQLHGAAPLTATSLALSVDEDQAADTERQHIAEQVGYAVFAAPTTGGLPNDVPTAADDLAVVDEDGSVTIDVLANDGDPDGDPLVVTSVTAPAHGTVDNLGTELVYSPEPDYCVADGLGDLVSYVVDDGQGGTATATVTITVACVNDPPLAQDDAAQVHSGSTVTIDLLANDVDIEGDTLTIASIGEPTMGNVAMYGDGSVDYTAPAGFVGTDSFEYTVCDAPGACVVATVVVDSENTAPIVGVEEASVVSGETVTIDLLDDDLDPDGDALSVVGMTDPGVGAVIEISAGVVEYAAPSGFVGTDTFDYTVCDSNDACVTSAVSVVVAPTNPPVLEYGTAVLGESSTVVALENAFVDPVVICTANYANNTVPMVVRVSNVAPDSFQARLQNPSRAALQPELVSYLVVESGAWEVDGVRFEAQSYPSKRTSNASSWKAESQSYLQSYANPVVFGQVMSENDPDWSVFWDRGSSRTLPPSAGVLATGLVVGEDPDTTRESETIGIVVFEAGHGSIAGTEFEARLGDATILGVGDAPPYRYDFATPFTTDPTVAIATMAGVHGGNGGWAQLHGTQPLGVSGVDLSIDEDQVADSEREHVSEHVAYVVFAP